MAYLRVIESESNNMTTIFYDYNPFYESFYKFMFFCLIIFNIIVIIFIIKMYFQNHNVISNNNN